MSGEDVFIELEDGLTSEVRISIFSEADQIHIQEWAQVELLKDGALEVRFATDISEQTKFSGARTGNFLLEKTWKESYEIILTNTSFEDFKNIKIEYLIIKFEEELQAQKRNEGQTVEFRGQGSVTNLPAREKRSVQTDAIPMRKTKLAPNYSWKNGGKRESEDEIRGIWAKIYIGGEFVMDFARPQNLPQKTKW